MSTRIITGERPTTQKRTVDLAEDVRFYETEEAVEKQLRNFHRIPVEATCSVVHDPSYSGLTEYHFVWYEVTL